MTILSAPSTFAQATVARADGFARLESTRSSRAAIFRDAREIIRRESGDNIRRESGDNLTVDALARRVLVSRRQLQRVFTEAGTTVRAEVGAARMERAAELLHDTSLPIREVARRLGYRQAAQFSKAFRQRYGLTPSRWRDGSREPPLTTTSTKKEEAPWQQQERDGRSTSTEASASTAGRSRSGSASSSGRR